MANYRNVFLMGFLFIALIMLYFIITLVASPVAYSVKTGVDLMQGLNFPLIGGDADNTTQTIDSTLQSVENTATGVQWLPYVFLILSIGLFVIVSLNVKAHPSMIVVWILFVIVGVIMSLFISNTLEAQRTDTIYYGQQQPLTSLLNRNLPYVVGVFGLVGSLFLFSLIKNEPEFSEVQI